VARAGGIAILTDRVRCFRSVRLLKDGIRRESLRLTLYVTVLLRALICCSGSNGANLSFPTEFGIANNSWCKFLLRNSTCDFTIDPFIPHSDRAGKRSPLPGIGFHRNLAFGSLEPILRKKGYHLHYCSHLDRYAHRIRIHPQLGRYAIFLKQRHLLSARLLD
jgi:hypothetical protein